MHALADYFPDAADRCGDALGVDKRRRFSGLSGYRKVLESGVEALAIEDIPYFYPEQAQAAVDGGCHVYMAKPVAVDVPGCLAVEEAARQATKKKLCFHIDYQMPTDPVNIEIAQRIWDGGLGKMLSVTSWGAGGGTAREWILPGKRRSKTSSAGCAGFATSPWVATHRQLRHPFDRRGDVGHAAGPVAAMGQARICRPNPHGDRHDLFGLIYECPNGMSWIHHSFQIPDHGQSLYCDFRGELGSAQISYGGKSFLRGGPKPCGARDVVNLYEEGASGTSPRSTST